MRIRHTLFAGMGAATLLLAACNRSEPPPPAAENDAMVEPEPVAPTEPAPPRVVEVPRNEAAPKPRPAPEISADQQVIDDADATGMTARVTRGDDAGDDGQLVSGAVGNRQD